MRNFFSIIATFILFAAACTQRTDTPPANRDGIAGGSNMPKQDLPVPSTGRDEPVTLPADDFGEDFILGVNEFTVLMGRFARPEEAEELAFALRMKRISNFIDQVGGEWLVCVGRYGSLNGARNTLKILRQKGYAQAETYGPGHPF